MQNVRHVQIPLSGGDFDCRNGFRRNVRTSAGAASARRPARHIRSLPEHLVAGRPVDRRPDHPLDAQGTLSRQPHSRGRQAIPPHGLRTEGRSGHGAAIVASVAHPQHLRL